MAGGWVARHTKQMGPRRHETSFRHLVEGLNLSMRNMFLFLLFAFSQPLAAAGQAEIKDYEAARYLLWSAVYAQGGETLYCGRRFGRNKGRGINVEHVLPMSWVTNALKCGTRTQCRENSKRFNLIEADLHNLFPARTDINDERSSYRFGIIEGEQRRYGKCDFEVDRRGRMAEPRPAARGEIARAMFYMSECYGITIFSKFGRLLKQWHGVDPVSAEERRRNDAIEKLQGTRNRFIDDPALVAGIRF